jgi:ankyrin repeat protein
MNYIPIVKNQEFYTNALINFAAKGNLAMVEYCIAFGGRSRAQNNAALECSIKAGHFKVVKYLVNHGSDPKANNSRAFGLALEHSQLKIAKYLRARGCNLPPDADKIFIKSASKGDLEIVKYFVELGMDLRVQYNAIVNTCIFNDRLNIVKYLEEIGHLNKTNMQHLRSSSGCGHFDMTKYLIEIGCDTTDMFISGTSPGHIEILKYVIDNKIENAFIATDVYFWCAANDQFDLVKSLFDMGYFHKFYSSSIDTIFRQCVEKNLLNFVEYLCNLKINLSNPVYVRTSSTFGHVDMTKYLVKIGCNVNEFTINKISKNHIKLLKYLVETKITTAYISNDVFFWCEKNGRFDLVESLFNMGYYDNFFIYGATLTDFLFRQCVEEKLIKIVSYILDTGYDFVKNYDNFCKSVPNNYTYSVYIFTHKNNLTQPMIELMLSKLTKRKFLSLPNIMICDHDEKMRRLHKPIILSYNFRKNNFLKQPLKPKMLHMQMILIE